METKISRRQQGIFCCIFHQLMSKDVASESENYIHIFFRKPKLQLSKLKSAILQLNTRCCRDCYTENAN